jgi:hypothetical protein
LFRPTSPTVKKGGSEEFFAAGGEKERALQEERPDVGEVLCAFTLREPEEARPL